VPRSNRIGVKYLTIEGIIIETELNDFLARIFQHEYDHLNGLSFLDRLETTKDIVTEKEFYKRIG
jgi:peptide deformylase